MFHPHTVLGRDVYFQLEDLHTEPGVFVDTEHGLATALLVGRCRLCGIVYMPVMPILYNDKIPQPTMTQLSLISNTTVPYDATRHVPGSDPQ